MRYFFVFLIFVLLAAPSLAFAINLNLNYPEFGGFDLNDDQSLPEIIAFFYYFIVGIAGLAAFVMLVWGGVEWLLSGAIPARASEARDRVRNAILGLLLILASFLVIQIINPELTILSIGGLDEVGQGQSPLSKPDSGVFLCEEDNCQGYYIYIDPSIAGCDEIEDFSAMPAGCDPEGKSTFSSADFDDELSAVRFDPSRWDVVLFEESAAGGYDHALCLTGSYLKLSSLQADLTHSARQGTLGVSWNDRTSAMRVVDARDFSRRCETNGLTLSREAFAPPNVTVAGNPRPVAFLYNTVDFGQDSNGSWATGLPLSGWARGDLTSALIPGSVLGDHYNISPSREGEANSILIAKTFCGLTGWPIRSDASTSFECAIFVADTPVGLPFNPDVDPYICFTHSTPVRNTQERDSEDSSRYKYSFDCDGSNSIATEISAIEVHAAGFCADPGVVQHCRP